MAKKVNVVAQDLFIQSYIANGGKKIQACKKAGIPYSTYKNWLKDPAFLERMDEARVHHVEELAHYGLQRAKEKSDTLYIFHMKALDPERFDDNIRKAKWLAENGIQDPDAQGPVTVVLMRDEEPARLADEVPVPEEPETEH